MQLFFSWSTWPTKILGRLCLKAIYEKYCVSVSEWVLIYAKLSLICRKMNLSVDTFSCNISNTRDSAPRREKKIYDVQRSIFDEIRSVWIADETLSRVFDILYQARETVFHWDIQTPRRELKILRTAQYLWRNSKVEDHETLSRVFGISSQSKQKLRS